MCSDSSEALGWEQANVPSDQRSSADPPTWLVESQAVFTPVGGNQEQRRPGRRVHADPPARGPPGPTTQLGPAADADVSKQIGAKPEYLDLGQKYRGQRWTGRMKEEGAGRSGRACLFRVSR